MKIEIRYQVLLLLDQKDTEARAVSNTMLRVAMNACKKNKLKRHFPEAAISKINKELKSVKK